MSLTIAQARDATLAIINTAWLADPTASAFAMHWDNVKSDRPGENGVTGQPEPWARTTMRLIDSPQLTQGAKRYQTTAAVTVQVFTPVGDGHTLSDQLAQVVLDTLRSHSGGSDGLHFFDVTPNEVGPDGPWFQVNVSASVRFQERTL